MSPWPDTIGAAIRRSCGSWGAPPRWHRGKPQNRWSRPLSCERGLSVLSGSRFGAGGLDWSTMVDAHERHDRQERLGLQGLVDPLAGSEPFERLLQGPAPRRSEERRVGKECRSRWSPY